MTITIEVSTEMQAQLRAEAAKRGMDEEECARNLLAEKLIATTPVEAPPTRSIMELHGLGAELWKDINVEKYINDMRDEWDARP